jgi:mannitol-1-/sugar-/sorbitol-6-phosphatase
VTFTCAAVLFDLDGVLVDSTPSVDRVWRRWAERYGFDPEAVAHKAHGQRSIETIRTFLPHADAEAENRIVEKMEIDDSYDMLALSGAELALAAVPPERCAIVTSGTGPLATVRMNAARLPTPAVMVSANEVTEGKPSPQPYLRAAELLGAPAGRCLVFEDTPAGIDSARAAGMAVIALTTTYPQASLAKADAIIRSLADVRICRNGGQLSVSVVSSELAR